MRIKIVLVLFLLSLFIGGSVFAASDPYYAKQWYLDKIEAEEAWDITGGDRNIVVAVIDTGVDLDQPDLVDNLWINSDEVAGDNIDNDNNGYIDDRYGWNFVYDQAGGEPILGNDYNIDAVNHGTFISGLISAVHNNGIGIKGVTKRVKIMPLAAITENGTGNSLDVSKAIDYAVSNGADVINLSFGGSDYNSRLKTSIIRAYSAGVLVVAASGNALNGINGIDIGKDPVYPICFDKGSSVNRVLGVLATDKNSNVASFSNYGAGCVDLGAPGADITSLGYYSDDNRNFRDYVKQSWNGSSFATGLVSGAAALMKSIDNTLSPAKMIEILKDKSGLIKLNSENSGKSGDGILNIKKALIEVQARLLSGDDNSDDSSQDSSSGSDGSSSDSSSDSSSSDGNSSDNDEPVADESPVDPPAETKAVQKIAGKTAVYSSGLLRKNGKIRVYNEDFELQREIKVFSSEAKGVNFKLIDVNDNGKKDIVAGAAVGDLGFVRVVLDNGVLESSFLPFGNDFRGGINVAAGDLDNDGEIDLAVAPLSDFSPIVKIYSLSGKLKKELVVFNSGYRNGVNLEIGDVNGDGKDDLVVAPKAGLIPKVKILDYNGNLKKTILAYDAMFTGGVNIALGDLNNDGKKDIITGAGPGGGPHVQAFTYDGDQLATFYAYDKAFTGGVYVRTGDWGGNSDLEIITSPGLGGGPHVKIFSNNGSFQAEFRSDRDNYIYGTLADIF
jgi:hypothetical protein